MHVIYLSILPRVASLAQRDHRITPAPVQNVNVSGNSARRLAKAIHDKTQTACFVGGTVATDAWN